LITELTSHIVDMVAQTADKESISKREMIRRIFTILKITQEDKKTGNHLGIVNGDKDIARFVGV
jgi:hypothetical protein